METSPIACVEISSGSVRLIVGHELNGNPICLYCKKIEVPGLFKDGEVLDEEKAVAALAKFHNIVDEQEKVQLNISRVSIVLPSLGLQVYQNDKTTNVIASTNQIERIDISNVISLVRKEAVPGDHSIVDIIPDEFVLDSGERFIDPPLGRKSNSLTIKAKIHALPSKVGPQYQQMATQAGFRVNKSCVSAYCASLLFQTYKDLPRNYLLVDIGEHVTDVSLIGNGTPFASASFFLGGRDLTEDIATAFGIEFEEAERLKVRYGYREEQRQWNPAICKSTDEAGKVTEYFQKDLNAVITDYFENYMTLLSNAVDSLLARYQGRYDTFPLMVTGGGSLLRGLRAFLQVNFPKRESYIVAPRTIGARDPSYTNLLGLILASSRYMGSLEDNFRGMAPVSRGPQGGKKREERRRGSSPEDDAL